MISRRDFVKAAAVLPLFGLPKVVEATSPTSIPILIQDFVPQSVSDAFKVVDLRGKIPEYKWDFNEANGDTLIEKVKSLYEFIGFDCQKKLYVKHPIKDWDEISPLCKIFSRKNNSCLLQIDKDFAYDEEYWAGRNEVPDFGFEKIGSFLRDKHWHSVDKLLKEKMQQWNWHLYEDRSISSIEYDNGKKVEIVGDKEIILTNEEITDGMIIHIENYLEFAALPPEVILGPICK